VCRFLIARFPEPTDPRAILEDFARLCRESRSPDGDRQSDGWGAAWRGGGGFWTTVKSIHPIWTDRESWGAIPPMRVLAVHARSASFPQHRENLAFNQPYLRGDLAFVFNGLIRGVSLPRAIPGRIGAQKLWHLLRGLLRDQTPEDALTRLNDLLQRRSREIPALNLGLCDGDRLVAFSRFARYPEYYRLYAASDADAAIVASQPLPGFRFRSIPPNRPITI